MEINTCRNKGAHHVIGIEFLVPDKKADDEGYNDKLYPYIAEVKNNSQHEGIPMISKTFFIIMTLCFLLAFLLAGCPSPG